MRYAELLLLRQRTIKDKFLTQLKVSDEVKQQYGDLLESIAREADQELRRQLSGLFGDAEANRLMVRKEQTEYANL